MSQLFREVNNIVWWDKCRDETETWLPSTDLRADALKGIATRENKLSIYRVDRSQDIERTIAAYAALRKKLDKIDFALFESSLLTELSISVEEIPGETPDETVNGWHIDLVSLSGSTLVRFGVALQTRAQFTRLRKHAVGKLITLGIESRRLDPTRISSEIVRDVGLVNKN